MITKELYNTYIQILKDELRPAMGCTEPISIAYAAAKAKKILDDMPDKIEIEVSRNIIKNVKSVVVPHTGGLRGIQAAVAAGIIGGDSEKELEVLEVVTNEQIQEMKIFLTQIPCEVKCSDSDFIFDIRIILHKKEQEVEVRIVDFHTNIVFICKNQDILYSKEITGKKETDLADKSLLTIEQIYEFADIVRVEDIKEILDRQISYNMAIAEEGLQGNYGANIGAVLLKTYGSQDVKVRARAYAAAASDARMNGCELPVVINSGSGNQGITASVPVIVYARELNVSQERLYRALVISNLSTIHIKDGIGRLSAYCGAVSAGCGSGAGIAYLHGDGFNEGAHALVNSLAILSGTICDGAKASCAAKIAASVDAGIMGYYMYKNGQQFFGGDGIIKKGVENTIRSIGQLASEGMLETDKKIVRLMIEDCI